MIFLFALLYPFLASTGIFDGLPSFSELMSGAFWAPYLGAITSNIDYKSMPESLQAYLPEGYNPLEFPPPFLNESLLAQAKAIHEKRQQEIKRRRERQNRNNAINRRKRQRSGLTNKDILRYFLANRGSPDLPYFVKKNRLALASRIRNQNSQFNPKQYYRRAILRQMQDSRHNIDTIVKIVRKIVTTTEKVESVETEDDVSLIETNANLNKSFYTITNVTLNSTTNNTDNIETVNNDWDKVKVNHRRSFEFGNNTVVKEEDTYEGEILVKDIGQSREPYVTKHIEHCPASGFVLKKDQQGTQETCYLCFCRHNETALCSPRNNIKCDEEHYQHNVVKITEKTRVRRSPFSLGGIFSRSDPPPEVKYRECKPHEDSKSEGCPPLDWCVGCNVCDCDAKGMWDCHLLSFCSDEDKRKKQIRDTIVSTTPKADKALRQRQRELALNYTEALVEEKRKKHRAHMGKDLRRKYFFQNGTLINQTLFNMKRRIKAQKLEKLNSTLKDAVKQYNLKVRNKDPNLYKKFRVVTGNQAKRINDANRKILGIKDKQTKEKMAEKNKQAMDILANKKVRNKKQYGKKTINIPAGLHIPDRFRFSRFMNMIGGGSEIAREEVKKNDSGKVYYVKSAITHEGPKVFSNAEETGKLDLPAQRRRVRKIMKELHGESDLNTINSKPRFRWHPKPRKPLRRMYAKLVKLGNARTSERIKVNKKKSDTKISTTSTNKSVKSNQSKNRNTISSTVKPQLKKEKAKTVKPQLTKVKAKTVKPQLKKEKAKIVKPQLKKEKANKVSKVDTTKLKSEKEKATTKKPATVEIKNRTQEAPTKPKEMKTISPKVNESTSSAKKPSKNKIKLQTGGKPTTKKPVPTAKPKKANQKALTKNVKVIKTNQSKSNETLGKMTSHVKKKSSPTKSSKKVKRSVQNKSPKTSLNVEDIFKRSYHPGETAIKYDVLGKQIYTNHNDIKTKGVEHELNYKSSSILTGSHKIWLQRHRMRRLNATRSKTNRVAKVIKPIAHQEQNDTRRLSIPFIRNNRQIPSANPKESRYIPVSNLHGYIHSQNRKNSQNHIGSLLNERMQRSMNMKRYHYKSTTNHNFVTEGLKQSVAPANAPKLNHQPADDRQKHSQTNTDKKSVQKRQKRDLREETSSLTTELAIIKKLNHDHKNDKQIAVETQKPYINEEVKATTSMTEATEWHLIPTETKFVNQIPTKFSYYKYSVEEPTNKIPVLDESKDEIIKGVILRNKNTAAKRSVDSNLPIHDVVFSQNLNESNIKTRSVTDPYDKEQSSNNAGETFTMIEGIRDLKKYQNMHKKDDVQMTFTYPISSETKTGNNIFQDITVLPNQVKTPSTLNKAEVHGENYSSQENNTTESLLIKPMTFTATEMYVGVNDLLSWMPADPKYIEGDKNNKTEPSVTERNVHEYARTNSHEIRRTNSSTVDSTKENVEKNGSRNKSNNYLQSKVNDLFDTSQNQIKLSPDFNNIPTAKLENINKNSKEKNNTVSLKNPHTHFTAKAIKNNSQSERFNISTLTKPSFEYEGNGNASEITSFHYVPLGTLFKNNANKKVASTEQVEILVPALKLNKNKIYKNFTRIFETTTTEKNKTDSNLVTPNTNVTIFTVKFNITTENDHTKNLENISTTTFTVKFNMTAENDHSKNLENISSITTEQAYKFPKKNIKSSEIKKLSLKKYQLKKIVPTLYSNKIRNKPIIIANDTSNPLKNNKTNDLSNIFNNIFNGIKIKNKKNRNNNAKRFKILKYLQKFFKTIFTNNDKHNKKNLNSTIDKINMVNNLCAIFGPCNNSVKNDAKLQRQIDNLNNETYKMLRCIKIIKGLLKLIDFRREDNVQYDPENVRSHFKSDVQKLRAILRDTYLQDDTFKNLTANQRTQIAYIKNNTQYFIQSAAKFTMILSNIINMISNSEQTRNAIRKYPKKYSEIGDKDSFRKSSMSYKNGKTVALPLRKLKDLITKYNFVQNTFMRKMFKILSHIFPTNMRHMEPHKKLHEKKNNKTEAIQIYTKNIIQNLQKLKALAQNIDGSVRRKRQIRSDDSLEYMLMMMEFLLNQNHQLDSEPENDGIDLLLDAINSAPDIKAIKKKVLQTNLLRTESNTDNKPKKYKYDTRRTNADIFNNITTLVHSEDSTIDELKTSTTVIDDNIFDIELKRTQEDNFTSKLEDSIVSITEQSDDDEDEDDAQADYDSKSSKGPTVANVRPYDHNNKKLATIQGDINTAPFLKNHVQSKSEFTTEIIPDQTKRYFRKFMKEVPHNAGVSNNLEVKEKNGRSGEAHFLKGDPADIEEEKMSLSEHSPLTTARGLIEITTDPNQLLDEHHIKGVPSVRTEWIDETYEELKEGDAKYSSTGLSTLTEDTVTETGSTVLSNDISGISKEALVPLEVLNFEKKMQDVSERSWLKVMADDYGREGGAFFSASSKEIESNDKYADDSDLIRAK